MSISSSSSSSSWSIVPAAGLKAIKDRKKECIVKVLKVYTQDLDPIDIAKRRIKVTIKDVRIE
jgi:hypothetical protein